MVKLVLVLGFLTALFLPSCVPDGNYGRYHRGQDVCYNPRQFPDRAGQRIIHNPGSGQIMESRRRIQHHRMRGEPDYAQRPGMYRSMQEHIDAETATADPRSAYDRAEVSRIKARLEEEHFWRRIEKMTGRKPKINRSRKYYIP